MKKKLREMNKKVIEKVIKLLTVVILMGTTFIWIMMPTSTYKKILLLSIRAKLGKSIYYGKPGVNLLLYMFPMILLAFLGCIYLHLKKQTTVNQLNTGEKRDKFGVLRRPMLVKGPLGIVTVTEVMFLTMFMAHILWSLTNYIYNTFVTITSESAALDEEILWQARLELIAVRVGIVGDICLAFLFYPVARGSSLLAAVGITSESSIKYHIWLGHLTMIIFTSHGLCYLIYWISRNQISKMLEWDRTGVSNLAGAISLVAGLMMWVTTYPKIRRRFFEVFFYTHYLYIVFMLFYVFHVGISHALIPFPGFYIFIVDRFLRSLQSRNNVKLVSARVLPCDVVELNFSKNPMLMYSPTSTMFVNIPSISKLQWHPFTITSSSKLEPETLSVMIKSQGKWSTKLYEMLSSSSSSDQIDRLAVSVEGPYGPNSTDFLRHESLVMVSGGSGITPFISIIRDLFYMSLTHRCKTPKMTLICAFKNSSELSVLDLILPTTGLTTDITSFVDIQIKAFVTREEEISARESTHHNRNTIKTLRFKPNVSDKPISPILGQNSWLCLATIFSSSFIIFIVIIAIITRYHIDQASEKYTSAHKSLIYLLTISISVVATCTAAMLWSKKRSYTKNDQYVGDFSLLIMESSPQQLLSQSTDIHYGQRPNLNKLLVGLKGSSVGVLVCGPKKMRQEVAKICSLGSAENLQFESISFSL
ncbi:PREDICTED: probable ferric reduction oxidase 1 [Camelina sativa]|uniref:Probable ferric reduction oxidase 1 n=1 Tax=Camelina sativa TaxID=90675 RepID=A0ABM0VXG4_CAMSA|nr:PREDICTED: probable ferric reduction oxidase 1 [Camelina sativa]